MTLTSILQPNWLSFHVDSPLPQPTVTSAIISRTLGLHQSCTSSYAHGGTTTVCRPFPAETDCSARGEGASFCAMWRTVGWLMSLATIMELAALMGVVVVMAGGKARREAGWGVLAGLLGLCGVLLFGGMAVVVSYPYLSSGVRKYFEEGVPLTVVQAYLFDNHSRFAIPGWRLDTSWVLCTVSGTVVVLAAVGVAVSAYVLPPEDGYEFLPDRPGV